MFQVQGMQQDDDSPTIAILMDVHADERRLLMLDLICFSILIFRFVHMPRGRFVWKQMYS